MNLLFILPEFLNSEDVEFVWVDVRQETVRLSDRLSLRCASAVSHQINTVTCTRDTDSGRFVVCNGEILQEYGSLIQKSTDRWSVTTGTFWSKCLKVKWLHRKLQPCAKMQVLLFSPNFFYLITVT